MRNSHGTNPMRNAQKSAVNNRFQVSHANVGLLGTFAKLADSLAYAQSMANKGWRVDVWDRCTKKVRIFGMETGR